MLVEFPNGDIARLVYTVLYNLGFCFTYVVNVLDHSLPPSRRAMPSGNFWCHCCDPVDLSKGSGDDTNPCVG